MGREDSAVLELKQITKTFHPGTPDQKRALDGVTLTLERGEFVTIVGSNGAGKALDNDRILLSGEEGRG